jgi:hypothetical protein
MVQEFPDPFESTVAWDGVGKDQLKDSLNQLPQKNSQPIDIRPPDDYGIDYYRLLRQVHKERTASTTPTAEDLFATFKLIKNSYEATKIARTRPQSSLESKTSYNRNPYSRPSTVKAISNETQVRLAGSSFNSKTSISECKGIASKLELVEGRYPDSVANTIKTHHDDFILQNELYRKEEQFILRRKQEQKIKLAEQRLKQKQDEVRKKYITADAGVSGKPVEEGEKFVKNLKNLHKKQFPEDLDYMYPDKLASFYTTLPEKDKPEVPGSYSETTQTPLLILSRYYNSRLKYLYDHCCKQKGTRTEDWNVMYKHWKEVYPISEKKEKDLLFESDINAKNMVQNWMKVKLAEEQKRKEEQRREIHALKTSKMAGLFGSQIGRMQSQQDNATVISTDMVGKDGKLLKHSEIQHKRQMEYLEKLSTPKERLLRGKTLVSLQSKFPNDKILQAMLVDEFANERIVKKPLEYDNVDSEEEDDIKRRHYAHKKKKGKDKPAEATKRSNSEPKQDWLTDEKREALRAKELSEKFKELAKRYQMNKDKDLQELKKTNNVLHKEKESFDIYLEGKVVQYRNLMKQKQNQEVPSENKFLADVYAEAKETFKKYVAEEFPMFEYKAPKNNSKVESSEPKENGEAKKSARKYDGETRSFPLNFKHHFFSVYRAMDKKSNAMSSNKVGFWAPAGKPESLNSKVMKESRTTKEHKVWQERKREGIWEDDRFNKEKQKILMKFDEVENCTFAPAVRSKLPDRLKISKEGQPDMLYGPPNKDLKKKMEEYANSTEFQAALRKGFFNKAMNLFIKGKPIDAYKMLNKHFDLNVLRKEFNPRDAGPSKGTVLFSILHPEKLKRLKDDEPEAVKATISKKEGEEKGAKKGSGKDELMRDVHTLAAMIENHQKGIERQIKRVKEANKHAALAQSQRASSADKPVRDVMCPLGEHCPDFMKDRWPMSNEKGHKPLANKCPFAHHAFDIQSKGFMKNNKKLKEDLLKKLNSELAQGTSAQKALAKWYPAGKSFRASSVASSTKELTSDMKKGISAMLGSMAPKSAKEKKIAERISKMAKADDNYRLKMGYLNRARIYYEKRRFKDAFETIIKAVAIVKKEETEFQRDLEKQKKQLLKKLDLSFDAELDEDLLLKLQAEQNRPKKVAGSDDENERDEDKDPSLEQFKSLKFQKLVYFAEKTGVIGEKKVTADQDLKDEIEDLYLKIVKHFKSEEYGIQSMEKMLKRYEGNKEDKEGQGGKSPTRGRSLPNKKKEVGGGDNSVSKKFVADMHIDMVPDSIKISRLRSSIQICADKIVESKPVRPWRYTGNKDTMENPVNPQYLRRPDKPTQAVVAEEDEEEDEEEAGKKQLNKNKTPFYNRPMKDLKQLPFRKKAANGENEDGEGDDDEEEDEDEELKEKPAPKKQNGAKLTAKESVEDFAGFGGFNEDL